MKNLILGAIGLIVVISAVYFTVGSQSALELAFWCLFYTVLVSLIIAYDHKAKYNNSFKEALIDNISFSVVGGIVCFGGLYFYLF